MNKNTIKFDKEEREINDAIDKNSLISVPISKREINELKAIARNTFSKTRSINIRISERDLLRMKALASREGVPYQTLISSTLHKKAEQSIVG
jgi:predicted DNA binding CopG/RHH family protein